ncbi:hypothetical protein [Azospirillum formosense]|uniref:hypothetical protein n=1 Tax=Azospirillum formosense TaxID=861533 RepID=UPI001FECFB35|nr:hypothetical protein [Azospirillum formosense]
MGEGGAALWRAAGLFLALVFYGLLSAPAPAEIRPAEGMIGALLVLGVGLRRPLSVVTGQTLLEGGSPPWEAPAVLALAVLLWCPLMRGVWLDWAPGDMVRDVVPLLYLFLPVLLVPLLRAAPDRAAGLLAGGLAVAGVGFALRWWKQADWGFGAVGVRAMADGGVYLLNAPSVLFAAIALPAFGGGMLTHGGWLRRVAGVAAILGGLLCLVALAGAVHRMALGLAAMAFAALGLWWLRRAPLAVLGAGGWRCCWWRFSPMRCWGPWDRWPKKPGWPGPTPDGRRRRPRSGKPCHPRPPSCSGRGGGRSSPIRRWAAGACPTPTRS